MMKYNHGNNPAWVGWVEVESFFFSLGVGVFVTFERGEGREERGGGMVRVAVW